MITPYRQPAGLMELSDKGDDTPSTHSRYRFSHLAYDVAAMVADTRSADWIFTELDYSNPEIQRALVGFSKDTILHYYIFRVITLRYPKEFRKNPDYYINDDGDAGEVEYWFDIYGIEHTRFLTYLRLHSCDDPHWALEEWYEDQEESFDALWEKVTSEVFHILFSNRRFLMLYNSALADYLKTNIHVLPAKSLAMRKQIRRARIPTWVKRAVYFRDGGRCLGCNVDLSGLLSTDRRLHYDHIIPLKNMGVNDPTNIQLLCSDCNCTKAGDEVFTSDAYARWW